MADQQKAAAAVALNILQGGKEGGGGAAKAPQAAKEEQSLDPAKKKVKKSKAANVKAFAEFKRDVVSRLTRIEQLLEQQAIMLRYPAPVYPHLLPAPPPNGVAPAPPAPRGQAFSNIAPAPPFPSNVPYFPPSAPPPQPSQPSTSTVPARRDEGDPKRRRFFAGMDLRDHRKVSNKRGGRGTRKTCRKCAAEGIENVLLVGHKCPYGDPKVGVKVEDSGGVKRASDGLVLGKFDPNRSQAPLQNVVSDTVVPHPGLFLSAPSHMAPLPQIVPSAQSATAVKVGK